MPGERLILWSEIPHSLASMRADFTTTYSIIIKCAFNSFFTAVFNSTTIAPTTYFSASTNSSRFCLFASIPLPHITLNAKPAAARDINLVFVRPGVSLSTHYEAGSWGRRHASCPGVHSLILTRLGCSSRKKGGQDEGGFLQKAWENSFSRRR